MQSLGDVLRGMDLGLPTEGEEPEAAPPSEPACPLCNGYGYLTRDVAVGHPDFGKTFPCECRLERMTRERRQKLEEMANLGPLTRLTFDKLNPDGRDPEPLLHLGRFRRAVDTASKFARAPSGWLVLAGPPGSGKTHLAAAIANYRLAIGEPVLFVVVPDLLDHLRSAFRPSTDVTYDELFEVVRTHPLLILDDLGTQTGTAWADEKLFQILNTRYNHRLPTVITTNHSLDELGERLRVRITDQELSKVCWVQPPRIPALQRLEDISPLMRKMTFIAFQFERPGLETEHVQSLKAALGVAKQFAKKPNGWLVLRGGHGCGKTHLASAIANTCLDEARPANFVAVPDLLDHLRSTFGPESIVTYDELFEMIRNTPLLILDDFGTQTGTAWAREKLYQLFNHRYNYNLPTVITTNLDLDDPDQVDPRLSSRLRDPSLSKVLEISAPDYRKRLVNNRHHKD